MLRKHVTIGAKYNLLTVIRQAENYISPKGICFRQYECKCDCGTEVIVLGSSLTSGHTKSCGCLSKQYKVSEDKMIGKRFGRLTVVGRAKSHKIPSGSVYDMWNCVCDCGNTTVSFGRNLRNGHNISCGCFRVEEQAKSKQKPKAEKWAKEYFDSNKIKYEYQKTFAGLKGLRNPLSYDFYLSELNILLELNGDQHYKEVDYFGGKDQFDKQRKYDAMKKQYAVEHNYKLIIIDTNRMKKEKLIAELEKII